LPSRSHRRPAHLASGVPANSGDLLLERRLRLVEARVDVGGRTLCDLGCGNGAQTLLFAPKANITVGIDVDFASLRSFRASTEHSGLSARTVGVRYDGEILPLPDASVDVVTCFEVLEHVASEKAVLAELRRVLRPGGRLVISVPNRWWIFETHGAELPLLPWNRVPFFSWLPKRIHDRFARARIYTSGEIRALLAAQGYEIEDWNYVTAPMDVLKWRPLQRAARATLFGSDRTQIPFLAVSVLVFARRPQETEGSRA